MSVPLDALYDQQLRAALEAWQHSSTNRVVLATETDGWRFAFFRFNTTSADPLEAITGDIGVLSRDLVLRWASSKQIVPKLEYAVVHDVPHVSVNTESFAAQLLAPVPAKVTKRAIQVFLKQRDSLLEDMKRPNLPSEVINWVYARSAGICEFEGCPAELSGTTWAIMGTTVTSLTSLQPSQKVRAVMITCQQSWRSHLRTSCCVVTSITG